MSSKYRVVFLFWVIFLCQWAHADNSYLLIETKQRGEVPADFIQYHIASTQFETDTQILMGQVKDWQSLPESFSPKNDLTYWFKLSVEFADPSVQWLLSPGFWHESEVFVSENRLDWSKSDASVFNPLSKREYKSHLPNIVLKPSNSVQHILVKVKGFRFGRDPINQKIQLIPKSTFQQARIEEGRIQGGFMGFALAIAGFHLVLWLWFREKTYLWLVVAMIASPVFYHAFLGFGFTNLWPEWPFWNEYASSLLAALVPALYLRFGASFLNLKTHLPRAKSAVVFLFYATLISSFGVFYHQADLLSIQALLTLFSSLILLGSSIYLGLKGLRYAWYFVVGNLMTMIVLIIWPFIEIGNLALSDLPFSIINFSQFGSAWLGILLALGMVDRMQSMKQVLLKQELQSEKQAVKFAQQTRALIQAQNEELESSNKALKELDDLKDEFLARTSHELNTPLNGIIGLSQILLDDEVPISEAEKIEYLELIASRGEHLKELVSELLEFVKTRKEVINLYREKIDISSHIEKIVLTFQKQAEDKGLYLENVKNIPIIAYADPRRFRQVITILLDNAIKYTDKGGIKVEAENNKKEVVIRIIDTGVGISKDQLDIIFEPFKQLKHDNRTRDGAGLGLSICKHLIEIHGGRLEITSSLKKGSTFSIFLPVKPKNIGA